MWTVQSLRYPSQQSELDCAPLSEILPPVIHQVLGVDQPDITVKAHTMRVALIEPIDQQLGLSFFILILELIPPISQLKFQRFDAELGGFICQVKLLKQIANKEDK